MLLAEEIDDTAFAEDLTDGSGDTMGVVLYGSGDVEDPFADADLGIWFSSDPTALGARESEHDEQRESTTVRGHTAFIARSGGDPMLNDHGATEVAWAECEDLGLELRSHRYSPDQLASIAEGLRFGDDSVGIEPGSIDGLAPVLELSSVRWTSHELPAGVGVRAVRYYGDPEPTSDGVLDEASYRVTTLTVGDRAEGDVLRTLCLFDRPGSRQVPVRGHEGLVYKNPTGPRHFEVFWMESPTTAVIVTGYGGVTEVNEELITLDPLTEADTLDFAERLRPTTPDEAASLLASSDP